MQNKRKIIILSAIIFISFLILYFFVFSNKKEKEYVYIDITEGAVKKTISVTGSLDVVDPTIILSKIGGIVENVYTDYNKTVKKGKLLIRIDDSAISQNLMKISSNLDSIKLELSSAKRELEGKKNLFRDNLVSKKAVELSEIQYKTAYSKYKRVKLDYDLVLEQKKSAKIYSPINGSVIALYVQQHQPVGVNHRLILLAPTLKKMSLTIDIDESDIGNIKEGQSVYFSVSAYPEIQFKGVIQQVRINPKNKGGVVTYEAQVTCDNSKLLLKPGMTATATVVVSNRENVLRVPNQAFIVSPENKTGSVTMNRDYVYIKSGLISGKNYKKVKVVTGISGDMNTEIKKGLKPGDKVLVKVKEIK